MKAKVFQAITQAWVNEHLDKQACGSRLETDGLGGAGPGLVLRSVGRKKETFQMHHLTGFSESVLEATFVILGFGSEPVVILLISK